MAPNQLNVFIADDHKIFVDGIARLLEESGRYRIAGKYHTGTSLLADFRTIRPDLVVLDVNMPGMGGLEVICNIRLIDKSCKIAVLSMHEESTYSKIAYRNGADGYFSKSVDPKLLVSSLDNIMNGVKQFAPEVLEQAKPMSLLSDRETDVVRLIAAGKTSLQIAEALHISGLTVKTHRQNIMRKLNASNTAGLIRQSFSLGVI